jgi:hypothetical protein
MRPLDPFDPDHLRLNGTTFQATRATPPPPRKPPRHRPGEWFLRGPVPWPWLEIAARLPGKALAVALCLWREAGRQGRPVIKLCLRRVGLGVSEQAARRALQALETAGLVTVERPPGRGLVVTLLDAPIESAGAVSYRL